MGRNKDDDEIMDLLKLVAGFLSGLIGGMGLGGGAVLLIYLRIFEDTQQINAQGINLLFFIPIGLTAVIFYSFKKLIKWKAVIPFALCGMVGAVGGYYLSGLIGGNFLGKIFGAILVILGISEIIKGFHLKKCDKGDIIKKE